MICKDCKKAGKKSEIYVPNGGFATCMGSHSYYDEKGRFHRHDPNHLCMQYRCSNGHSWSVVNRNRCPTKSCEFNKTGSHPKPKRKPSRDAAQEGSAGRKT